jgi:hypothetical protein
MDDRDPFSFDSTEANRKLHRVVTRGVEIRTGDHVRLRPLGRGDIFDLALEGKMATVVAIEQDFEDRVHLAVTVDDDPGRHLGREGKIGHRFFFGIDEVEPQSILRE